MSEYSTEALYQELVRRIKQKNPEVTDATIGDAMVREYLRWGGGNRGWEMAEKVKRRLMKK